MKRDLMIGEVAERAGVTVKTLRFYSDAGQHARHLPPRVAAGGSPEIVSTPAGEVIGFPRRQSA